MNDPITQLFGNLQNFQNQFAQVQNMVNSRGISPQQLVQNLLNSGQMTQEQFNQYRGIANMIAGQNL